MPTILSSPPHGAIVGMALVPAMPTMPARIARMVYQSMAPQWLVLRRAASAMPVSRAASMAASMAKVPPIWPMELPPSTTMAPPVRETSFGFPRGSTPSAVSFFT